MGSSTMFGAVAVRDRVPRIYPEALYRQARLPVSV